MKILFILISIFFIPLMPFSAQAQDRDLSFSVYGKTGVFKPNKTSFLGRGTAANPEFSLVEIDNSAEYHGYGVGFSYDLNNIKYFERNISLFGSVDIANIIDRQNFGVVDTGGSNLILPGVGVGSAGIGFELGGYPLNRTDKTQYRYKSDQVGLSLGLQQVITKKDSQLSLMPFVGFQHQNFDSNTKFSAEIPLFLESFTYNTNIEVNSFSPFIGTDFSYAITPAISLIGTLKYMYDVNFGEGEDTLDFTFSVPQSASMNNDENTHSGEIEAGLNFQLSKHIDFSMTAKYGRYGNIPVMETRTGIKPSDFDYKTGEIITGGARLTFNF